MIAAEDGLATENRQSSEDHPPAPDHPHRQHGIPQATIAVAFAVLLLVLATTSQGAFAISRWAPLTLFTLAALIGALLARGGIAFRSRPVYVALGAVWALALWSMLSMVWAKSSGNAFEAGDRMILYAAIATLPFAFPLARRSLAAAGWSISIGIGAIALYVMIRLLIDGSPLFLAGRLNGPVNYRNATALLFALPFWPLIVAASARSYRRGLRASGVRSGNALPGLGLPDPVPRDPAGARRGRVRRPRARARPGAEGVGGRAVGRPASLRPLRCCCAPTTRSRPASWSTSHDIAVAAQALAILTVVAFGVGLLLALFDQGLRANSPQMRHVSRAARIGLAVVALAAVVGGLAAIGNPATFARNKWDQFTSLSANSNPSSTRLVSVGGQRYDLWRVAVKEFEGAPLLGVGSDNYEFGYYQHRKTNRNLDDPHSLLFALLAENGIVGVVLFLGFLGGMAAVIRRGWPAMSESERRHVIGPAAVAAVLIGQSAVDWIWLIPGLTAVGIFALSVAAAQAAAPADVEELLAQDAADHAATRSRLASLGRPVAVGALVVAVAACSRCSCPTPTSSAPGRSRTSRARSCRRRRWRRSSTRGRSRPTISSPRPTSRWASARRRSGELRDALSLEPQNSATLGVLGDFEARGSNFAAARSYYRRALALNPLDVGLQQLARIGLGPHAGGRRSS